MNYFGAVDTSGCCQIAIIGRFWGFHQSVLTDPSSENRGGDCPAGLECLLNVIRALRMGSCFSEESRSPYPGSPCSPALGVRKRKNLKKRPGSRSSSFEYRREQPLHMIPGRMLSSGSSDIASLFTQQGKKGTNQDAMIVWENFGSRTDTVFCGVFDGHGPYGHMVAKKVRDLLPLKLSTHLQVNVTAEVVLREISLNSSSMNSEDTAFASVDEEKDLEIFQTMKDSFLKAFKVMDRELRLHKNIDCFCSGTTAVTLIKQGEYIFMGNVGDSRAVLARRDKDNTLVAVQLTVDLKPNLPAEAERIRKCKGRVFALHDEPEVARVWLPKNNAPGLAMARAFGDFCLKDFGLISVPEVSYRRLTEKDEFIVLATDGIWDVLSNKEVVDIVAAAPARSYAARSVVESAVKAWRYKYPTSKVDDCAVVCLFLDPNNSTSVYTDSNRALKDQQHSVHQAITIKPPSLSINHSGVVHTVEETLGEAVEEDATKYDEVGIEWSALEGVSRVNTLLTLPRFVPGEERVRKERK